MTTRKTNDDESEWKEKEETNEFFLFFFLLFVGHFHADLFFPIIIHIDTFKEKSRQMYSDTECTRRATTSVRSYHSTSLSNRYIRGLGSNQDLSKRTQVLSSPSISDIIYNNETFPLLAEFLQIHGREGLVGFCAIVIGISNLTSDKRQALYAVRAAYKQYIDDESISTSWLQSTTRDLIRQQISQRLFDPYKIFQPAMKDMLQYLKQNFYSNFLSSQIWKNYLMKKDKRNKGLNASTPKKLNASISTSTVKSSKQANSKRDILTSFNGNRTIGKIK